MMTNDEVWAFMYAKILHTCMCILVLSRIRSQKYALLIYVFVSYSSDMCVNIVTFYEVVQ